MKFTELGISSSIEDTLVEKGYAGPTSIQIEAIPPVLDGKDLIAVAQTGTGKTAAFLLPLLEHLSEGTDPRSNRIHSLILVPTRELASQVEQSVRAYSKRLNIRSAAVYGGVEINPQMMKLRKGVHILVATPGRLLDLYRKNAVRFDQLQIFVFDEADRMLNMGFEKEICEILVLMPKKRQTLMFSATFSDEIKELAKKYMSHPEEISVEPEIKTAVTVEQCLYSVDKSKKSPLLIKLLLENDWKQVLIFTKTKNEANRVTRRLEEKKISAFAIHSNKSQSNRTKTLARFKRGDFRVLVATDVASRGLDIQQLPLVVNYNLPHVSENYIHRIGRTGRAEESGHAISLVCAEEFKELFDIERLIQNFIPRKIHCEFEPLEKLKESPPIKPVKKKRPKKKKKKITQ